MWGRKVGQIGLALSGREITAVILGRNGFSSARTPVSLDQEGMDRRQELAGAFGELRQALERGRGRPTHGARAYVTLMPPLADARVLSFPPMRADEVQSVVRRDVARYFLGAERSQVVGIRMPRRGRGGRAENRVPSTPVLAAAAPLSLLEDLKNALHDVGWRGVSFSPAHSAWMAVASSMQGEAVKGLVAVEGSTAHVMRLDGPNPTVVRKIPSSDGSAIAQALRGGPGRVLVLTNSQGFGDLQGSLANEGLIAVRDRGGLPTPGESAASRADAAELQLVSPTMAGQQRARARRHTGSLLATAAVLVVASFGVRFLGARRELNAVQDQRAGIRAEVAPLLAARDSLEHLAVEAESMEEISRRAPLWTRALVELTALLPRDAYLTGFYASGDTVEIEGAGARAGSAIQALREAGVFEEVRLEGVVERELEDGETAVERFRLWARVPPGSTEGG